MVLRNQKKKEEGKRIIEICIILSLEIFKNIFSVLSRFFLLLTPTLSEADVNFARSDMVLIDQNDVAPVNGQVNEFSENVETIRDVLRQYHKDNELQVIDMACFPGSKAGDNYMSQIKRIEVKIRTKSNAGKFRVLLIVCYGFFRVRIDL